MSERSTSGVAWEVEHVGGVLYRLVNVGAGTARGVAIEGRPTESAELVRMIGDGGSVGPYDQVEFSVMGVMQLPRPSAVAITWEGHPDPELRRLP